MRVFGTPTQSRGRRLATCTTFLDGSADESDGQDMRQPKTLFPAARPAKACVSRALDYIAIAALSTLLFSPGSSMHSKLVCRGQYASVFKSMEVRKSSWA